jgi:HK97 family phage prohead protease
MTMALCGYATRWNHIIDHHGYTVLVDRGAFDRTLRSGTTVKLLPNHFDHQCVGSTTDNLELCSDQHGLAFRFRITKTEDGRTVSQMAENGNDSVSIGFDWHGARKETRRINGVDVACIIDATLFEISFLHGRNSGAVKDAYATLKDTDYSKSLRDECSGGQFLYEGAAVGFKRALNNLVYNI